MGKIKIISRPNPAILPEIKMPMYVRSAGANESSFSWNEYFHASKKPFVQIFWTEAGTGEIVLKSKKYAVHPGDFFFHLPGEEHLHKTIGETWNYRWFTMDGPLAVSFIKCYSYEQTPHYAGECPVGLFSELEILLTMQTPYSQRHALSIAAEILALAGRRNEAITIDPGLYFLQRLEENLAENTLSVQNIARDIGVHRTTLTRLVKQKTGMLPGEYLQKKRLNRALSLLKETNMSLKEISLKCGLSSPAYLCTLIRRHTGISPEVFRRKTILSGTANDPGKKLQGSSKI